MCFAACIDAFIFEEKWEPIFSKVLSSRRTFVLILYKISYKLKEVDCCKQLASIFTLITITVYGFVHDVI